MSASGQAQVQKRFDALYGDVKEFFKSSTNGKLSIASVTVLTRYAMEIVQTSQSWQDMKGSEKKNLVLGVLNAVIQDLLADHDVVGDSLDEGTKQAILTALEMAPMIIDAAVDFAKVYSANRPQDNSNGNGNRPRLFCCC